MTKKAKALLARYQAKANYQIEFENVYHANAFTYPLWSVLTNNKPDEIQMFRWGLVPKWIKTAEEAANIRANTLNARSETVFEKPSFKFSVTQKRCLIPSTGFFEWRDENKKKIPYYIYLKDVEIFSLAGIYENWTNKETGEIISGFSILTCNANSLMEFIHNSKKRMPVIISPENEKKWISDNLQKNEILEFCKPFDCNKMNAYVISNDFLKKNYNDESIILPV